MRDHRSTRTRYIWTKREFLNVKSTRELVKKCRAFALRNVSSSKRDEINVLRDAGDVSGPPKEINDALSSERSRSKEIK